MRVGQRNEVGINEVVAKDDKNFFKLDVLEDIFLEKMFWKIVNFVVSVLVYVGLWFESL